MPAVRTKLVAQLSNTEYLELANGREKKRDNAREIRENMLKVYKLCQESDNMSLVL